MALQSAPAFSWKMPDTTAGSDPFLPTAGALAPAVFSPCLDKIVSYGSIPPFPASSLCFRCTCGVDFDFKLSLPPLVHDLGEFS